MWAKPGASCCDWSGRHQRGHLVGSVGIEPAIRTHLMGEGAPGRGTLHTTGAKRHPSNRRKVPFGATRPGQAVVGATQGAGQNAASGTSMRSLSVASAMARSAASRGRTCRAKNFAAATLPV